MRSRLVLLVLALAVVPSIACSNKNPVAPGFAPVPGGPALACPADIVATGVTGNSLTITYAPPAPEGGYAPVNASCSPASGSTFPLGTTLVSCMATDALNQKTTCSFNVMLSPLRLNAVKFLAFGDSLTEGENGNPISGPCPADAGVQCVDAANSYPSQLARLLKTEFPSQATTVVNAGIGGERVEVGRDRLLGVLSQNKPDVLLLLEGFNDLLAGGTSAVSEVVDTLREDIRLARQAGVKSIYVSTLVPSRPPKQIDPVAIDRVNAGLRTMVPAEGAVLVDTYPLFLGRETELISADGLHLTPAGYGVLAGSFFTAIKGTITSLSFVNE